VLHRDANGQALAYVYFEEEPRGSGGGTFSLVAATAAAIAFLSARKRLIEPALLLTTSPSTRAQ
jgi:hypothetical protein